MIDSINKIVRPGNRNRYVFDFLSLSSRIASLS